MPLPFTTDAAMPPDLLRRFHELSKGPLAAEDAFGANVIRQARDALEADRPSLTTAFEPGHPLPAVSAWRDQNLMRRSLIFASDDRADLDLPGRLAPRF